jgi:hypothetical protein
MVFQFSAVPGLRYQILTSTNPEVWKDFTAGEEAIEFVQPYVVTEPMRFFKAVMREGLNMRYPLV